MVPRPPSLQRLRRDRLLQSLLGLTLVATAGRLVALGSRTAQYDEGWVGYWVLRYAATGDWAYRPLVHGPFFPHVNRVVFELLGASDFTARLVPAILGGLLPLVALLYRDRLRDAEVAGFALLLAANPILLYYSRFMRFDFPLAAFVLLTVGLTLRAVDRENPWYLLPAGVAFAIAFATKENVVLYPVCWLGASLLLLNDRLLLDTDDSAGELRSLATQAVARLRDWWRFVAGGIACFGLTFLFFFAPRSAGDPTSGLWSVGANPAILPGVLETAFVGSARKAVAFWVQGGHQGHPYLPYLGDYLATLAEGAPVLCLAAVVGFLADRFGGDRPRDLVGFAFVWGVLSIAGYPLANFLQTPWSTVHAVAPLAIPAGVGLGTCWYWARERLADEQTSPGEVEGVTRGRLAAVGVALLFVSAGVVTGTTAVRTSYTQPMEPDSELVYLSQPPAQLHPTLSAVETAIEGHDGTDVLYFGDEYAIPEESIADRPPAHSGWHARLPLPWYVEAMNASTDSTTNRSAVLAEQPPVIVTDSESAGELELWTTGYVVVEHDTSQLGKDAVFLIRADRLPDDSPVVAENPTTSRDGSGVTGTVLTGR
jgi:uncharacterized protein (TIGR03663 family)